MRIYERIDEQGRMYDWFATPEKPCGEVLQSHGFSFMYERTLYEEIECIGREEIECIGREEKVR